MEAFHVDVLIITALKDELDAVLAYMPRGGGEGNWARKRDRHGFPYHVREFINEYGEPLRMAVALSGEMGESGAATRATALIDELSPEYLAMCGICAGKQGDTFPGDVIVADRVYSYDHGKLIVGDENKSEFFHDIETYNLQKQWLMDVEDFARSFQQTWVGARSRPPSKQSQKHWLLHALLAHEEGTTTQAPVEQQERQVRCPGWKQIVAELVEAGLIERSPGRLKLTKAGIDWVANDRLDHPDGLQQDPAFRVHIGSIASGKTVREDPELFVRLARLARKTLGVEMEAAAIGAVAQKLGRRSIIVKAVSDHADHEKDDAFRAFACKASAAFLIEFLRIQSSSRMNSRKDMPEATPPVPRYSDEQTRHLSLQLEYARKRKRQIQAVGADTTQVDLEILALRRGLREGGRLRTGDQLGDGRFLLLESIGQGGFATVWKALDRAKKEEGELVAIKVLHPNLADSQERRERFFRGARRMAELQHPAVARVIEQYGEDGGYYYFIMEYVSGGNLRQAVLNKTITPDKIIPIVHRIGEALALAHTKGIIHRDIKPANILLDDDERPLLSDFDLVGAADTTGGTRTGALGTAAYAAPECLEHPQKADPRSDVYSLGMTALFGFYGADLPFPRILGGRDQFFSQLRCPELLKTVLYRATSLEPSERYNHAGEFIKEVRHASSQATQILHGNGLRRGPVPALTIVSHPMAYRVGERLLLDAVADGYEVSVSRSGPDFMRPDAFIGLPLADPFVCRQPLVIMKGQKGGIRLLPGEDSQVALASALVKEPREFSPEELTVGVPLELDRRVVVLLHWADPAARDALDALGMVGTSMGLQHVRSAVELFASEALPVLIRGETGSGKELIARAIHQLSSRCNKAFVSVNLREISKKTAAAQLFGISKGSSTGARRAREGFFHAADGGTLFLDEVGEAPLEVQEMLLRVLETGSVYPLGKSRPINVNVRVVAAADARLEQQIRDGNFMEPLLHRLAGYQLRVPPLRERREDIGPLFYHFAHEELESIGEAWRLKPEDASAEPWLPTSLAARLLRDEWPGNIRQLRNLTRQLVIGNRGQAQLRLAPQLEKELTTALSPRPGHPVPTP